MINSKINFGHVPPKKVSDLFPLNKNTDECCSVLALTKMLYDVSFSIKLFLRQNNIRLEFLYSLHYFDLVFKFSGKSANV